MDTENKVNIDEKAIESIKKNLKNAQQFVTYFEDLIEQKYNELELLEQSNVENAKKFGIEFNSGFYDKGIPQNYKLLKFHLNNLKDNMRAINDNIVETQSAEVSMKQNESLYKLVETLNSSKDIINNFSDLNTKYQNESENVIKKGVDFQVQDLTIKEQKNAYQIEFQTKCDKKIGLIGKLLGKEKLRQEEIENLELKIKLLENKIPVEKLNYTIKDMLSELVVCSLKVRGGNFSGEMSDLYNLIKANSDVFHEGFYTEDEIYKMAKNKMNNESTLIPMGGEKKETSKQKIEKLKFENQSMQTELFNISRQKEEEKMEFLNSIVKIVNNLNSVNNNLVSIIQNFG